MVDEGALPVWVLIMEAARRRHAPMAAQDVCTACAISVRVGGVGLSVLVGNRSGRLGGRLEPLCAVGEPAQQLLEPN
ncbi:hypothetical protein [Nonomuraea polychroma]|uniref:hypothetical protein n=1 Tax=Nonomuraea polychroma TaxID=46176 RepID=UPI000FDF108C|nr:hypothetical protein [Nonomuraea polychroma]